MIYCMVMRAHLTVLMAFLSVTALSAGSDDAVLSFSTKGPDRYADGTTVMDGECYALVWSKDGVFDGLTAAGTPVDVDDKVVIVAPVAKDGRCPDINFQIDAAEADANADGVYAVYLLDTRVKTGGSVRPSGSSGGMRALNGYGAVTEGAVSVGAFDVKGVPEACSAAGQIAAVSAAVPADRAQPRVKNFRVDGDNVYLTVENLGGYLRVQHGSDVSAAEGTGIANAADGAGGDVVLVAPRRGKSGFYKVVRN